MSLYVLDAFIWVLGIRGHIPQGGEFGPVPAQSSCGAGTLMRVLAIFVMMVACLSLVLWLAIWLAIKLP
ncbi:hypothetical protein [Bradyrhizobium sp.]|uniref:hypothetical protein n=1 Tax=Bradyrhizobium sp. TaxID=376 RepID=UPI0025BA799C|nr:hypothetical protein [Bradyrhizobium sp.]